ncbi:MAG: protein kinase domain-containing protein [Kiritimatiellia bacterium]
MYGDNPNDPVADHDEAWLRQYYTRGKAAAASTEPAPVLTPQPAAKYSESQPLGAGGEKEVVQVRDRDTLRDVALARPRDGRSPQAFVREARILARLEHPHIVPVHDLGLTPDGRPYFTMKLLAGETLESMLARLRQGDAATIQRYPLPALLEIFVRVCDAVAFAHSRGVLHRDIKPANVQIGQYGEVRLIDWGLAKCIGGASDPSDPSDPSDLSDCAPDTLTGTIKGTPGYMAPEQAAGRGELADVRTDTYALGALLYALLTWQPPVTGDNTTEVLCKTVAGGIVPPRRCAPGRNIPPALDAIVCKALAVDPADRYATADALLADVHAFTNGYATSAETAGPLRLLWLVVKRHRALSLVIAASLLVLAIGGVAAVARIRVSRDETRLALTNLREEQVMRTRLSRAAAPKLLAEARAQIRAMAYEEALETLRTAIGVDPSQTEAWDLAGWLCLGQEKYALAAAAFDRDLQAFGGTPADAAAARRAGGAAGDATGPRVKRDAATRVREHALRHATGLAVAEHGRQLAGRERRSLTTEEYRLLLEEARQAGSRPARDSRTALGAYCARRNPSDWTNVSQRAFVQWAVRALHDGHAEVNMQVTGSGLEAQVTGAAACDLLPLVGLPLVRLDLHGTSVRDLQPLRGMPLRDLDLSSTPVATFEPLYGLPLRELGAAGFRKLPADLFARCPTLETITVSPDAELSRKDAAWPAGVRVIRRP